MDDGAAAVRAVQVTRRFGEGPGAVTALDGVTVAFPRGLLNVVMGPSGSGKSTLLHCLAGLDAVDSGAVHLDGIDITQLSERALTRLRRDSVGFVFQSFNLLSMLTAAENVLLPLRIAGRAVDRDWIGQVIGAVGLADRLGRRPSELSGGEQQRLAVARALAGRPSVVFADEPTGNLDSHASAEVLGLLRRCVDELAQTIVLVTHDKAAADYSDRVVCLADGRVQ